MSGAYYNENEPFAAAWLRELIKADLIAPGEVDERSIEEVKPDDLRGFTQCHFFAGIGVWSYALRNAGWSDDSPVWTGSCPCQSFSASGKRGGFSDKRHLWPTWFRLISECRPDTIFGEQVASKDGLAWFDVVSADMEGAGYSIGATDLCAAGFGAPHIRQRLYFVAESSSEQDKPTAARGLHANISGCSSTSNVADSPSSRRQLFTSNSGINGTLDGASQQIANARGIGNSSDMENSERSARARLRQYSREIVCQQETNGLGGSGSTNGFWRDAEWIYCRDEKYRPVEPGTFPLVNGTPNRVGRLRGYGNAINAEVAKGFIEAYMSI